MVSGTGNNVGWVKDAEQTENGGVTWTQHGEVKNVGAYDKLCVAVKCTSAPAVGTLTVKIQHSPDYQDDAGTASPAWEDLITLAAFSSGDTGITRLGSIPDGVTFAFFQHIRIVATNSESGQSSTFHVSIRAY